MEAVEHIVCPAAVLCKRLLPRQIPPRLGIWNEKLHCKQPGRTTGAFSEQQPSRGENQAATRVGNQSGKFYSLNGKSYSACWRCRQASVASPMTRLLQAALAMTLLTPNRGDNLRQEK